jgi:hypothetical protein
MIAMTPPSKPRVLGFREPHCNDPSIQIARHVQRPGSGVGARGLGLRVWGCKIRCAAPGYQVSGFEVRVSDFARGVWDWG